MFVKTKIVHKNWETVDLITSFPLNLKVQLPRNYEFAMNYVCT